MNFFQKTLAVLGNIQILSALIWATVIIACSWIDDKGTVSSILITAAGIHVLLMMRFVNKKRLAKN